jgi:hypothetical protein
MLQGTVIRGTTPAHDFNLTYPKSVISDVRITYGQKKKSLFTKTLDQIEVSDNGIATVVLTQEETLLFTPTKTLDIEVRILFKDGTVVRTEEPISLRVIDTMDQEVME